MDMYPGQRQPPTHIGDKFADLRMSGPSTRGCGPSGPAATDPIFRSELPRPAPKPPHVVQTRHMAGQSAHGAGRSAYLTERSGTEFF
jgi:hypothetical protein